MLACGRFSLPKGFLDTLSALAILGLVALIYWPVSHGGFYWDDNSSLHDEAWLRGDAWKQTIFRGFNDWINYFRPLVVALFALEIHRFNGSPEPMHVVSLGLHLANTLLVGLLAQHWPRLCGVSPSPRWLPRACMLFYGLHPALIEPTFWIGCQFELVVTLFILLGLFFNTVIKDARARAILVGLCFFLAACAKEAAAAFPVLLLVLDLAATHGAAAESWGTRARATWRRQRGVYVAVLLAGIAYIALRYWALGYTVFPMGTAMPLLPRLQKICLIYVSYWKLIVWPMTSIGPIHQYDDRLFGSITGRSLFIDLTALTILFGSLYAFWKRQLLGCLILAATVSLLPVLQIVPVAFNEQSLYQDRYAMIAVAVVFSMLPAVLSPVLAHADSRLARLVASLIAVVWLGFAIINIRITVPLWADAQQLALWQWAVKENPDSVMAKDRLLAAYIGRNDRQHARQLADALVAENAPCPICMINAAYLAIADRDPVRGSLALSRLKDSSLLAGSKRLLHDYVYANALVLELQGDLPSAEEAHRDAITLDPLDPASRIALAIVLAKEGKTREAQEVADIAIPMFAPDEREQQSAMFEQAMAAAPH